MHHRVQEGEGRNYIVHCGEARKFVADPYGVEVVWVLVVGCWTAFVVAQYFHGGTSDAGNGGGESRHGGMDFIFNNGVLITFIQTVIDCCA